MKVVVELFGIPKYVAQRHQVEIELPGEIVTVGEVIQAVEKKVPSLNGHLRIEDGRLQAVMLCVNETLFLRDTQSEISKIESVLLTSLDVGG